MFNFLNPFYLLKASTFYGFFDILLPVAGAAAGFAIPGAGLVGAAIGAGIGSSISSSNAQGKIAKAQADQAEQQLTFEQQSRKQALAFAQPTVDELQSIDELLQQRTEVLSRNRRLISDQQQVLDATSPAIKEAGQQALQLLRGQEAKSLSFIRNQRDKQRTQLEQNLAARLGSGFATSTAGIAALTAFDDATDRTLFDSQQSQLNSFLNISQNASQNAVGNISNLTNLGINAIAAPLNAQQNISNRQVSAIGGTPVNFNNSINAAGSQFKAGLANSRTLEGLAGQGAQFGLNQLQFNNRVKQLRGLNVGSTVDSTGINQNNLFDKSFFQ